MSERSDALKLAERILDRPHADHDDVLAILSRQLLRKQEALERLEKRLQESLDPTLEMIQANRDTILCIHEEGLRKIKKLLDACEINGPEEMHDRILLAKDVIKAINTFHPMHGESWSGWPEGS